MKLKAKICKLTSGIFATAALATTISGCDSMIYDDSDCVESYNVIRFEYTHNMKFADAFAPEVDRVTLLAFNSTTGKLAKRIEATSADLKDGNKMVLAIEPGEYDLLAWGGDYGKSFDIAAGQEGTSTLADFHCRMQRTESADGHHVDKDLAPLYHGLTHVSLPYASPSAPNEVLLPVKKNTNVIRVVLQHISGEVVDHTNFEFSITDKNGWLNHDNTLRDGTTQINYHPWHLATGSVDINQDPTDAPGSKACSVEASSRAVLGASLAEFTLNRLLVENNPILTVTNKNTGGTVLRVPLKDYALLVKGFYHQQMSDQEYLDRQDEYNMTFFLDEGLRWVNTVIIINNWRVVRHEMPFE